MNGRARTLNKREPVIHLHKNDLPNGLGFGESVAVDTETQGLSLVRDRLCLVQLSAGDGHCHLVQLAEKDRGAPNLRTLLADPNVEKIFHYARFDVAMIQKCLNIEVKPVFCTKIASKLARTYTGGHGLKDVCREIMGVDMDKQQQSSDWAAEDLTRDQLRYAAMDVLYLHEIKDALTRMLIREDRLALAAACFDFLSVRATLDLLGWGETDIFSHK